MAKQGAVTAMPRLRFPEFREAGAWSEAKLDSLIDTVSPPAKLPSSSYLATGKFPIIDQSQDAICGWTDDPQVVIEKPLPLIVFGDHTCVLKFVARPFAQGADGIKILAAKPSISIDYLFHSLNHQPLVMEDYKRHFSTLKERQVFFPGVESGEQQKISDCLTSLDAIIAAQGRKVEALKAHKRGLMQQLFPREGETRPRLRFPEFRDAPEWELKTLSSVCEMQAGKFVSASEISDQPVDGRFPCYGGNGLRGYTSSFTHSGTFPLIGRQGALCGNVQLAEGDFYATEHALVVSPKRGVVVPWLYYTLGKLELNRFATGQAQPGLSVDVLKAVECSVPATELEQQRIADCLTSVDMQIAAESNQLAALKTHKQGLMQQLFPAPEATGA